MEREDLVIECDETEGVVRIFEVSNLNKAIREFGEPDFFYDWLIENNRPIRKEEETLAAVRCFWQDLSVL